MNAVKENLGMRGNVRIKEYDAGTLDRIAPFVARFKEAQRRGFFQEAKTIFKNIDFMLDCALVGIPVDCPNLIMRGTLTGKDLFIQYLIAGTIYSGINYGALGTSATTPAITDTQLGSESARVTQSLANDIGNNEAQIRFFFPDAFLSNTTYHEFGMFMNGAAGANTGALFNHSLLSPAYVKTASVDTTIECDITLT